jgi:hypothetical protein
VSDIMTSMLDAMRERALRAEARLAEAEHQLADIRRQMEEARKEGNWPLADVLAERDRYRDALERIGNPIVLFGFDQEQP